jgi:cytochrome c oxidase cbb3-type subunit 3
MGIILQVTKDAIEFDEDPNEIDWSDELDGTEQQRLTDNEVKKLTVYVHQFGGGQ